MQCAAPPYADVGLVLSLFWAIQVSADSTSESSLAVNPSMRTPVASAFFLASSALATVCTQLRPRRTLAVNFCCFSSVMSTPWLFCTLPCGTIHDNGASEELSPISLADAGSPVEQGQGEREHEDRCSGHDREGERHVDVARAEKAIAEGPHHVEDGIRARCDARSLRQHVHRVEDAAQVGERREHEGREPGDLVEVLGEQRIHEAAEREHDAR